MAVWDLLFGNYDGQEPALIFGSADGTYLGKVDRPVVVQGRMFNPRSPNEVVVDENAVNQAPPVGGTFTFRFYAHNQVDETGPPHGPTVTMHVVGVVRETAEFVFVPDGQVLVSPGFMARYGSRIARAENADIVLRHGEDRYPGVATRREHPDRPGSPVLDAHARLGAWTRHWTSRPPRCCSSPPPFSSVAAFWWPRSWDAPPR